MIRQNNERHDSRFKNKNHTFAQEIWNNTGKQRVSCLRTPHTLAFFSCSQGRVSGRSSHSLLWHNRQKGLRKRIQTFECIASHFRSYLDPRKQSNPEHTLVLSLRDEKVYSIRRPKIPNDNIGVKIFSDVNPFLQIGCEWMDQHGTVSPFTPYLLAYKIACEHQVFPSL